MAIEYKRESFNYVSEMVRWLNGQNEWQLVNFVLVESDNEVVAVLSRVRR